MKKTPLAGLIYREFYIAKKYILIAVLSAIVIALIFMMMMVSMRFGNLRLLTGVTREVLESVITLYGKYLPLLCFCMISECLMEVSIKVENMKWNRFRLAAPISGFRFAAARFLLMTALVVVSVALCAAYLGIYGIFMPSQISIGSWGIVFICLATINFLGVLMQVYGQYFHSMDKAGLAVFFTIAVPIISWSIWRAKTHPTNNIDLSLQSFEKMGATALPYAIISLIAIYVIGFVVTGFLYQRREK